MHGNLQHLQAVEEKPKLFTFIELKEIQLIGVVEFDTQSKDDRD